MLPCECLIDPEPHLQSYSSNAIGHKLAHYEILSLLGKDGMGEVWRARDTKIGQGVAIKTLPGEFAKDVWNAQTFIDALES